jgi:hypothetical protein
MTPKPGQFDSEYGTWFQDPLVVAAYPKRPPYPAQTIELFAGLIVDEPRVVLDVGCGPGDLGRRLAPLVERVDAVLPMFALLLTPRGVLAIVERNFDGPPAMRHRFTPLARRYSAVQDYQPIDLVVELEQRSLFVRAGSASSGLREALQAGEIALDGDGRLELTASARVSWGKPRSSGRG